MPHVRLRDDGPQSYSNRSGVSADQDDPVVDVDADQAEYLVEETGYFERVDEPADGDVHEEDGPPDEFDLDAFLDQDYTLRVAAVEAGDVDEHLGAIEDEDTSQNVLDAIDERRDELEE